MAAPQIFASDDDLLQAIGKPPVSTTPDDAILGALTTPQMKGPMRVPALAATNLAQGAAQVAAIPGNVAGLLQAGTEKLFGTPDDWNAALVKAGIMPAKVAAEAKARGQRNAAEDPTFNANAASLFGTPMVNNIGRATGVFNRPDLQPQNTGERYLAAGSQGVGSAIPFALGGGPAATIGTLASGGGSGIGAQAGQDLFPNHPIVASVLGSLAGGLGTNALTSLGEKAANAIGGVGNAMTDAYRTAGVTPRLAGDVTQSPFLQQVQAFAAKTPFGAGRIERAAHATLGEFGDSAENVASRLGASETPQDVGTALQGESAQWMQNFRNQSRVNWDGLDSLMPQNINVSRYSNALDSISRDLPGAPATANVLQPPLTGRLQSALGADTLGMQTLPWQTVKGIRTRIGEMLSDPNLPAETNVAELRRLYSGLTSDMQSAATAAGPQAQAAFNAANDFTRNGHQFIDQVLRPIVREGTTPEQAAQSVLGSLNKGGTKIAAIRAQMPNAADEVGAFKVRDMASATAGRQNAAGDAISPNSFLTDWNKMAPEARMALYTDPATEQQLNALARISEGIRGTMSRLNTSNTGAHSAMGELFNIARDTGAGFGAGHLAGHPVLGALAGFGAGITRPLGGFAASRLTSSPGLTAFMAAPSSFLDPRALAAINALGISSAASQPSGQLAHAP